MTTRSFCRACGGSIHDREPALVDGHAFHVGCLRHAARKTPTPETEHYQAASTSGTHSRISTPTPKDVLLDVVRHGTTLTVENGQLFIHHVERLPRSVLDAVHRSEEALVRLLDTSRSCSSAGRVLGSDEPKGFEQIVKIQAPPSVYDGALQAGGQQPSEWDPISAALTLARTGYAHT